MKKITFMLFVSLLLTLGASAQMSFTGNSLKKSAFDLNSDEKTVFKEKNTDSKIFISDEDNDTDKKRRKKRGRRGGSGDFALMLYSRIGLTVPIGSLSDYSGMGFMAQGTIEGLISNKFAVGITYGYYVYSGKSITIDDGFGGTFTGDGVASIVMPIAATFKYFFMEDEFKPYAGADIGIMFAGSTGFMETKFGGTLRGGFLYNFGEKYLVGFDGSCNLVPDAVGISFGIQFGYVFGN